MAPMYFQNFLTMMAPQPLPNGGSGWAVPIDPAARVMHAGDVTEVGRAVAAALAAGDQIPDGSYLGVCGGVYSFNDFVGTLNAQGHKLQVLQVESGRLDCRVDSGFSREVRDLDTPAGQLLAVQAGVDQMRCLTPAARAACTAAVPVSVSRRHLRGIPEVGHDEGSVRPLERGTEGARVEQVGLDHLYIAALPTFPAQRLRWRDCGWQRAPRTCPRP